MAFIHQYSSSLKKKLEQHYRGFDAGALGSDPVIFPHRFNNQNDIELVALISSVFAYGNVKLTAKMVERILGLLGRNPTKQLKNLSNRNILRSETISGYRYYTKNDVRCLLLTIRDILLEFGTIGRMIKRKAVETNSIYPKEAISIFNREFQLRAAEYSAPSRGLKFMFPDPALRSACKRFNLFLRWMVRKDLIDFGLWQFMKADKLIIPVDTHISSIALRLGLTERITADWKTAAEITESLRLYDSTDPVRYDFALCHIGMWGIEF